MALFGQERTPRADPRIRRNFARFRVESFLVTPPLTLTDGVIGIAAGDGLDAGSTLAISLATDPGLEFSSGDLKALVQGVLAIDASGIKLNIGSGLANTSGNLVVSAGNGITLAPAVTVSLAATPGLEFSTGALTTKVGAGLELTANGIEVDLATDSGLEFDSGDLRLSAATTTVIGGVLEAAARTDSGQDAITLSAASTAVTDPADAPADADALRDDLVANAIPDIVAGLTSLETRDGELETAIETLAGEFNDLLAKLRTAGVLDV